MYAFLHDQLQLIFYPAAMIQSIHRDQKQGRCTYLSILVYNPSAPFIGRGAKKKKKEN